jgi:hypothetical protein
MYGIPDSQVVEMDNEHFRSLLDDYLLGDGNGKAK